MTLLKRLFGTTNTDDPAGTHLSEAEVWAVIGGADGQRRRRIIEHLHAADRDGPHTLGELAEALACLESDEIVHPDELGHQERKRVYISLYQVHLPQLVEYGVVVWNPDADAIFPSPTAGVLAEAMQAVRGTIGGSI